MRRKGLSRLFGSVVLVAVVLSTVVVLAGSGVAIASSAEGKIAWSPLDVWVSNPDGSSLTRLTCFSAYYPQAFAAGHAVWSADGSKIAFERNTAGLGDRAVWVMNGDGSGAHYVGDGFEPALSPDGSQVAFVNYPYVYVANSDGTNVHTFAYGPWPDSPTWSPDGSKLAYADIYHVIWIWDVATDTGLSTIPKPTPDTTAIPISRTRWSPDGTKLAFVFDVDNTQNNREVWTVNVDGSNPTQITSNSVQDEYPGWTPAGRLFWLNGFANPVVANGDGTSVQSLPVIPAAQNGLGFFDWGSRPLDAPENDCTTNIPGAPSAVNATAAGPNSASVTWSAPTSNGGNAITDYLVTPHDVTNGHTGNFQIVVAPTTQATINGLAASDTYDFTVVAVNAVGTESLPGTSNQLAAVRPIHVVGSEIRDGNNNPLVLRGVDYSGTEYMCAQGQPTPSTIGRGIFEGPTDLPTPPAQLIAWGINAVRLPLNEDCWLGINGIDPQYGGASYRTAVTDYVHQLVDAGIVPIVELSGSAPGNELAGSDQVGQQPMPDADHSIDFWVDVASTFKGDGNVVFDLFNEPFPDDNHDTVTAWTCWRDGGNACPGIGYTAVGMQQLVDTVRATGAPNLILLGGVEYSRINATWLDYEPTDPLHNLAASWHLYPNSYCNTQSCWDTQFQPFLSRAAAVATEIGQGPSSPAPCGVDFLDNVMLWLDAHNAGYLAWTWDAWGDCFSLIGNWGDASPPYAPTTPYGRTYHDHLLGIPQPPTSVVAAAGSATVAVSWQPPVDQGTSPISGYQVIPHDVSAGTDGAAVTVTGTTANVSVVNGRSYTFTVTATNDAGTGAPSAASAAVTPQAGLPVPAAATGTSSPATSSTVSTGSDPGTTGGTATQITVPAGTGGGTITVTQRGTTESSPTGYTFGGVQIDISAPPATQANPLTLVFTTAPPSGYPAPPDPSALNATDVYRAEGTGSPQAIPACNGSVVDPEPACVAGKQYVTLNASTYVQVTVLAETASHWNSARPSSTAVRVSNSGYSPAAATVQQGGLITWAFAGKKQDSVTESVGLGPAGKPLFDSGAKSTGSYAFQFVAAGTYAYKSTVKGDSFTGSAAVAPAISHPGSSYVVIWAAGRMTGYVFDVQYRFKPKGSTKWGSWTAWQKGTTNTAATFIPPKAGGTYSFKASLRNAATGRSSGDSPEAQLTLP